MRRYVRELSVAGVLIRAPGHATTTVAGLVLATIAALVPRPVRVWCGHYAIKAWPMILIWFKIGYELIFEDFAKEKGMIARKA